MAIKMRENKASFSRKAYDIDIINILDGFDLMDLYRREIAILNG
jgi:hypothetical protein